MTPTVKITLQFADRHTVTLLVGDDVSLVQTVERAGAAYRAQAQ